MDQKKKTQARRRRRRGKVPSVVKPPERPPTFGRADAFMGAFVGTVFASIMMNNASSEPCEKCDVCGHDDLEHADGVDDELGACEAKVRDPSDPIDAYFTCSCTKFAPPVPK